MGKNKELSNFGKFLVPRAAPQWKLARKKAQSSESGAQLLPPFELHSASKQGEQAQIEKNCDDVRSARNRDTRRV